MKNPENNSQAPKKSASAKLLSKWWLLVPVVVFSLALPYLPQLYFFVKHYKGPEIGDVPHDLYVTKRLSGEGSIGSRMHWLDNETVFYWGYDTSTPPRSLKGQDDLVAQGRKLFLWKFGELERLYPDKGWNQQGNPCAGQGQVRYRNFHNADEGLLYHFFGSVGEEQKREEGIRTRTARQQYGQTPIKISDADCSYITNVQNKELNRFWEPFAPGDGYFLFGNYDDDDPRDDVFDIYNPETGQLTRVDIPSSDGRYICTKYNPYFNGLMIWNCRTLGPQGPESNWAKSNCYPIWAVWPDGNKRKYCLPYGDWSKRALDIIPVITKKGLFFFWSGGPASYLVDESGQAQLIRRGLLHEPSVSPDGCKVAGNYAKGWVDARWIVGQDGQHAAVIDLCSNSKDDSEVR